MNLCKCGCDAEVSEGKEFLPGHYAKWKAAQSKPVQEILTTKIEPLDIKNTVNLANPKKWWQFWKPSQPKLQFPTKLLNNEEIQAKRFADSIKETSSLSDEQKFLKFFGSLPKWTANRPGKWAKWLAEKKTGNKFDVKHVVFVSEDGNNKQAYIPYSQALGLFFTDDGYWDTTVDGKEPIFLDKNKFAPLINRKKYSDDFDIPEDHAAALVNTAIRQGRLAQFDELIAKINQAITIQTLSWIAVITMGIVIIIITYIQNKHYVAVEQGLFNLTQVIRAMP